MLPTTSLLTRGGTKRSDSTTPSCSFSMKVSHAKSCTNSQRKRRKASMWDQQGQAVGMSSSHLVAAVFLDEVSARDAIADLKLAGVHANQIGVALSDEAKRIHSLNPEAKHLPSNLEGKHSVL